MNAKTSRASRKNRQATIKAIVKIFIKKVKGRKSDTSASHKGHDGKEGHWLEKQMGIKHNASNAPDLHGFEMKNQTRSKITFGDWSPDYYIFKDEIYDIDRNDFLRIFGMPNLLKEGRFSWSGKPCPKIGSYNFCGQIMVVAKNSNLNAVYSFDKDCRPNKAKIVPKQMQKKRLVIAKWEASSIKRKVEKKFNQQGWFQCKKDKSGIYTEIVFGEPINFENWIEGVKNGAVFFDSGMYLGNARPYSQWRTGNKYWESLITTRY